jgi:hypothetical protein
LNSIRHRSLLFAWAGAAVLARLPHRAGAESLALTQARVSPERSTEKPTTWSGGPNAPRRIHRTLSADIAREGPDMPLPLCGVADVAYRPSCHGVCRSLYFARQR